MSGHQGTSSAESDRLLLHAQSTHLYRGARLQAVEPVIGLGDSPRGIRILFRDGAEVDAELLRSEHGELALAVSSHTTEAGTAIPEKTWRARAIEDADGDGLVVGRTL